MGHDTKKYRGQLAVVTGASSGIGFELANVFAENGFDLLIAADEEDIFDAAKYFETHGGSVEYMLVDLATDNGVENFYQKIKSMGRPVHSIAMNAGVGVGGEFISTDLAREMNLIQLNITSIVHLTKRILPDMVVEGAGKILFTSSIAAEMPGPYYAVYAASKAFVQSFAEALREELKGTGVTITSLQPGATETHFFARADMLDTPAGREKKDPARDVALDGFKALMEGKDHVVAGSFANKLTVAMAKIMPETIQAKMQGKGAKPDSLH